MSQRDTGYLVVGLALRGRVKLHGALHQSTGAVGPENSVLMELKWNESFGFSTCRFLRNPYGCREISIQSGQLREWDQETWNRENKTQTNIMNIRISNQLTMVGSCLMLANSSEYKQVWLGKEPADFEADMASAQSKYAAVTAKAAQADSATGGAADAKAMAESTLEDAAFVLARALANHFKKVGDLDRRGKVDVSKSEITRLRTQDLVNKATAIRDLATSTLAEEGAEGRGVTAARVATLTAAITAFSQLMNTPRGQIVNRGTLLKEVETDTAALVQQVEDMDDMVLQFDATEAGRRFIAAWKRARIIVDSGTGHSNAATPPVVPIAVAA